MYSQIRSVNYTRQDLHINDYYSRTLTNETRFIRRFLVTNRKIFVEPGFSPMGVTP
jgi:hypothetical protein